MVRGVPRDLGGNTAGEVVRQASDDDRDGGDVLGRLAAHGQHGVVLAAPGRQVRSGSFWAELPCPLKASHGLGRRTRTRARPATPGTISGDYALESRATSYMAPAHLRRRAANQDLLPGARFYRYASAGEWTVPRATAGIRIQRHQQIVSLEGSFLMGNMLAFSAAHGRARGYG